MAIQSWQDIIDAIRNGEPVTADVTNRAIFQLAQRTEHLKTKQDAQDYAQALFISEAPFTADVKTGHAVYFDAIAGKFAPAYADLVYKDGYLDLSAASNVIGIVVHKDTADSGLIIVEGLINPQNYLADDCGGVGMDANLLVNVGERGLLYLASGTSTAGSLIARPGLLNVPVCNFVDDKHLLVRPPIASAIDTQALRFPLVARPATPELILQKYSGGIATAFTQSALDSLVAGTAVTFGQSSSTDADAAHATVYLTATVNSIAGSIVKLTNVVLTKAYMQLLSAVGATHTSLLLSATTTPLTLKKDGVVTGHVVSVSSPSNSSYVGLVASGMPYKDATLTGWLPADSTNFPGVTIPSGAKYGYNFKADPNLHQLFPEGVVGQYVVFKDGVAQPEHVVKVAHNGLWWFDNHTTLPWHTRGSGATIEHVLPDTNSVSFSAWTSVDSDQFLPPTNLVLVYTKLISGGVKVVTSLEAPTGSPITITGPTGLPATTGPLVITAGFQTSEASTATTGSLVVKEINGFTFKRGHVVEQIIPGDNILLAPTVGTGQGAVTVSVVGLDGKLEGQPDILAIDDILVERHSTLNMFYSAMPPAKNSSLLGKVDIPNYLAGTYRLDLVFTFLALHTTGNATLPSLALNLLNIKPPAEGAKYNLNDATNVVATTATVVPSVATDITPGDFLVKTAQTVNVNTGGAVFFKLARISTDLYTGKLGIISIRHKFTKVV